MESSWKLDVGNAGLTMSWPLTSCVNLSELQLIVCK